MAERCDWTDATGERTCLMNLGHREFVPYPHHLPSKSFIPANPVKYPDPERIRVIESEYG